MAKSRVEAALSFLVLLGGVSLGAQTHFASFTGTISGTDGSPVPNVEVVATNVATQVTYTARSNDQGLYTISALPIGAYKVRSQAQGFQINETTAITLETSRGDFAAAFALAFILLALIFGVNAATTWTQQRQYAA